MRSLELLKERLIIDSGRDKIIPRSFESCLLVGVSLIFRVYGVLVTVCYDPAAFLYEVLEGLQLCVVGRA